MTIRIAHLSLSVAIAGAVTLAPVADVQASPLGMKLRRVMTLQPEGEGEAAAAPEGAAAAPEGPAPAPAPVAPAGPPPPKGIGMLVAGSLVTGLYALPLIGWGVSVIIAARRVDDVTGGTGVVSTAGNIGGGIGIGFGMVGLAVGVPLIAVGAIRLGKYNKWKQGQQAMLLPRAGRTAFGTITPGVEIRF